MIYNTQRHTDSQQSVSMSNLTANKSTTLLPKAKSSETIAKLGTKPSDMYLKEAIDPAYQISPTCTCTSKRTLGNATHNSLVRLVSRLYF